MRAAVAMALAACLALGSCARGVPDVTVRPVLPPVPADLEACLHREFPEIPERAFGRRDAVRIIADAKLLDRAKPACGDRALHWMKAVVAAFGRTTP
ncbi:hypothetical protein ACQKQD_16140 [Methylobacterium sp. NPDC080182]|uniref:hypothetical protein n=1 Tax=Methylobacterium sp. NPDC080182 TaxID=3390590 RepID=UPI003CFE05E0